ncbi:MAG: ribose-phosphate diphosphokinase [Bernardetiaceae bacterium]|nr:ribose-phosphate diphosphokinase [Bernardetiaceae bacterium]
MQDRIILFATRNYVHLYRNLLATGNYEQGALATHTFPDGECYYRILSYVEYKEAALIGGTISDNETLELYDIACGLVEYGVRKLNLVIPFYGYATMERSTKVGEIVMAKTRARLLSAVPQAYFGNRVICIDLHAEGISHYFEGGIRTVHLYAKPLIIKAARQLAGDDFILASTDAGRAKWVESLANDMHVPAAFVYKKRISGSETHITGINADVKNKNIIIYDDMIRTGGSILQAARAYKQAGAKQIFVIATHGLFSNNAVSRLQQSGLIERIVVTDTHPNALQFAGEFVHLVSVAELVNETLLALGRPQF